MVPPKKYSAPATMSNGSTKLQKFGGSGDMSYQKKDSGDVRKENKSAAASSSFRTDGAISGNRMGGERQLQRWVPEGPPPQDLSLESSGLGSANGKSWDQFAVNEQKFGLKTDYNENIYTTNIDKKAPDYQKKLEVADRIAREIEGSSTNNSHVAEERITDNFAGEPGLDEEDRFSGVRRQQDFPPLASANRSNKYTTPARRAPTGQSTVSGAPVDPAIISSQLARPDKLPLDKNRPSPAPAQAQTAPKADAPSSRPESPAVKSAATNTAPKTEVKSTGTASASMAKATAQPTKKVEVPASLTAPFNPPAAGPNATATIERDVNASFKSFALQQRTQVLSLRSQKIKQDKEVKLNDLKKFSSTFKLLSAVPEDLIPIIAKDPAKQKEIQERSARSKLEAEAKAKAAATTATKVTPVAPVAPSSDLKTTSKPSAPHGPPPANAPNRQNSGRAGGFPPQGPFPPQNRNQQAQAMSNQHGRQNNGGGPNVKMRGVEGNKFMPPQAPYDPRLSAGGQARLPPTGPSMPNGDSRRSSGIGNQFAPKLNPNSSEFRPTFSSNLSTNANPSAASSPRSGGPIAQPPVATKPFLRRKPLPTSQRPSFIKDANVLEQLKAAKSPSGKDYTFNGGIPPPFDTAPVFKSDPDGVAPEKKMVESFSKIFEASAAAVLPMSPNQPPHATPQVPHQHQLPFHLQQGAHAMPPRPSPRQPHMQMQHFPHGQPAHFNNHDDHRMMPSHSAQSFQSPRLHNVPMAYQSPMPQNAQIAYPQQQGMQYPMAPTIPGPNISRSYSNNGQFYPQGPPAMGPQVMMPGPVNNGFMGPQGMMPGQPMPMHGSGPGFFMPPGGGPPPMPGANGYPSPSRGGAPMMMNQGSQQGQPVYGMSPGMQFQQPVPGPFPQQQPGQMGNMRGGGNFPGQNYGTSPQQQMYQFNQQNRGPGGNYNHNGNKNNNYHPQQGPHTPAQQHQVPNGPQGRPGEAGDEPK